MKKFISNIMTAALLVAGAAFTACSSSDSENIIEQPEKPTVYKFTISATKDDAGAATRALNLNEATNTLTAYWQKGEKVKIYKGNEYVGYAEAMVDGIVTTLEATIETWLNTEDELTLVYYPYLKNYSWLDDEWDNKPNYLSQGDYGGTIDYISENLDCAKATIKTKNYGSYDVKATNANFINQQAILKCSLNQSVSGIYVTFNGIEYNAYGTSKQVHYIAIPIATENSNVRTITSDITISTAASKGGKKFTQENVTLQNGKFYGITANLE